MTAIYVIDHPIHSRRGTAVKDLELDNDLRVARVAKGWSQAEIAERVGVTRQTIGLIEAGRYNPTLKLCLALSRETGRGLDELFWIRGER
jgi:putative transcriptional regulator